MLNLVSKAFTKNFDNMAVPKLHSIEAVTEKSKMGKLVFPNGGVASYSHS